jgi:hypothetical protein
VQVQPEWCARAERIARLPHNGYASSFENLYVGLLAELAVIHYLVTEIADLPAEWLSPLSHQRQRRGHPADIRWNGLELDVKLIGPSHEHIKIKKNAEQFHHVFVCWHKRLDSFRILGVLLPHVPETFQSPVVLKNHTNRQTGHVVGWYIPRARLQPLSVLVDNDR